VHAACTLGRQGVSILHTSFIFSDIYLNWDKRHLLTAEVREMEDRIVPAVRRMLESIKNGAEPMELYEHLEA
jgi:hypothetical protein